MSDDAPAAKQDEGTPAWVMTFADLMSLLMCFFVLLLSFSEMDVSKYKEMAGSLKNAFGVQRDIKVKEPPKGINVIAKEFSPGRPEPTTMNVIRQMTTNDMRVNLDLGKERRRPVPTPKAEHAPDREKSYKPHDPGRQKADREAGQKAGQKADLKSGARSGKLAHLMPGKQRSQSEGLSAAQKKELARAKKLAAGRLKQKLEAERQLIAAAATGKAGAIDPESAQELLKARVAAEKRRKLEQRARLISSALSREIKAGSVDVETAGQKIIIRVREKASFGSGRAELKEGFRPILARVAKILKGSEGKIIVAGHTDNVPIYTRRFRSNWELSAARAVSVAHEMMLATDIPSERFLVQGFADTEPVAKNDTAANRAKNRRVEIILQQGEDREADAPAAGGAATTLGAKRPGVVRPAKKSARPVSATSKKTLRSARAKPSVAAKPAAKKPAGKKVSGIRAAGGKAVAAGAKGGKKAAAPATVKGIKAAGK